MLQNELYRKRLIQFVRKIQLVLESGLNVMTLAIDSYDQVSIGSDVFSHHFRLLQDGAFCLV